MKLGKSILALALLAVLAALGACDQRRAAEPPMELRSYTVPIANQDQIQFALRQALTIRSATDKTGAETIGRASLIDKGQLLVSAPPSIHGDIARFLKEFQPSQRAPELRTALDFWVVIADGQSGAAAGSDRRLDEITEALDTIKKAQDVQDFSLVERLSVNHEPGPQSIKGARVFIEMDSSPMQTGSGGIALQLEARPPGFQGAELHTTLRLVPGKAVVLGQSGIARQTDTAQQARPASIFYVVRSRALE